MGRESQGHSGGQLSRGPRAFPFLKGEVHWGGCSVGWGRSGLVYYLVVLLVVVLFSQKYVYSRWISLKWKPWESQAGTYITIKNLNSGPLHHMSAPLWKQILELCTNLQMAPAPAGIFFFF